MTPRDKTDTYLLNAVPADETDLLYAADEKEAERGCIGRLRGDFGRRGNEFWTTWFDCRAEWKTQAFKDGLDALINCLREDGNVLSNLRALMNHCYSRPDARLDDGRREDTYGFKIETDACCYYLRANLTPSDYNFYVFCFNRGSLEQHLAAAQPEDV